MQHNKQNSNLRSNEKIKYQLTEPFSKIIEISVNYSVGIFIRRLSDSAISYPCSYKFIQFHAIINYRFLPIIEYFYMLDEMCCFKG